MKKLIVGLISFCFICGAGETAWPADTFKPVLKQNIQKIIPLKTTNKNRLPELYITSLQTSAKVLPGKKLQSLSITVKNSGVTAARGNQTKRTAKYRGYMVSVSLVGKTTRHLITIQKTPTLQPNQSMVFKLNNTVTIPENLAPGTYTLRVVVDPENAVPELKESNNTRVKRIQVKNPFLPDLTASLAGSPAATVGSNIPQFNVSVRNTGNGLAKGVPLGQPGSQVVGYFFSIHLFSLDQPSTSGIHLKTIYTTPDLKPGQDHAFTLNNRLRIPANTPAGSYQVRVMVDSIRKVVESNETNNISTYNIRINAEIPAELNVSIVSLSPDIEPGGLIPTCSVVVTNTGAKTAMGGDTGFSIILALSSSTSIPLGIPNQEASFFDGMLLHKIWYPNNLPPNQSATYQVNMMMRVPVDTPAGTFNIIAVVDPENKVSEINETNNSASQQIRVSGRPDLALTRIVNIGTSELEITIKNNGPGRLPDSVYHANSLAGLQYYLDNQPKSGFSLSSLDPSRALQTPGGSITKRIGTQINCTATPGHHIVRFELDRSNALQESNEANNTLSMDINCP